MRAKRSRKQGIEMTCMSLAHRFTLAKKGKI